MELPDAARELIEAGALGHLATISASGAKAPTNWMSIVTS